MALSEEQIQKLLVWFMNSSETKRRLTDQRIKAFENNHKWIQPDIIKELSDKEIEAKFLEYYRSGGGRQGLNQIYRDRIIRDKKLFRKTIMYLLDEKVDLKERVDNILGGEFHIEGFGRAILTSFLMDYNPEKYCLWNNKTEMGLSVLGWDIYKKNDSKGNAYLKILSTIRKLSNFISGQKLSFDEVDLFLHTISAEDEGKLAVENIKEGLPPEETRQNVSPPESSMEFSMEKYLEEFIEKNFNIINFGAHLELYQDEESKGRQFPTPIGNIDLLAVDKEKKEFVVIELKKGRSGDAVVGQILRYMGWVVDNLAKDYKVRGIIIVKEKDETMEYALKLVPDVSLFTYIVSFSIKKEI